MTQLPAFPSVRRLLLAAAVAVLATLGPAVRVQAAVPGMMNYQGYLADNAGNPVTGTYAITFKLFADSTIATPLWTESYSNVAVAGGVFNVLLGTVSPLGPTLLDGSRLWLLTTVNGNDVLPRRPIVTVAYAFRAGVADSAARAGSSGGDITGQVQVSCGTPTGPSLIYVPGHSFVCYAAANGTFDLGAVPTGIYTVAIQAPGAGSTTLASVTVTSGATTNVGIVVLGANTQTDVNNCGSCGVVCSANNDTPSCVAGTCQLVCNTGFADCDHAPVNGCETNVVSNTSNCGTCGNVCPSGPNSAAACTGGVCQFSCNPGFANCDNLSSNGCEVNTGSDLANCGGCGVVCPSRPNSNTTCFSGVCQIMCNAGYLDCNANSSDGCEVSVNTDPANCGGCGHVCAAGHACVAGVCQ